MIVRTENSVYEIDLEGQRARRVETDQDVHQHHLSDGEWKDYVQLLAGRVEAGFAYPEERVPEKGDIAIFVFRGGTWTQTSLVQEVNATEEG